MLENDVVCNVLFRSVEMLTTQCILGIVDKTQLFSQVNSFIEVKNLCNRVIAKKDIVDIKIYKEYDSMVIDKSSLKINRPISIES